MGVDKHMGSGSRSKMDLSSGFWSYVVEMKTVVCGRKARTREDPRTKELGKPDHSVHHFLYCPVGGD